jgi:hypothetical protein
MAEGRIKQLARRIGAAIASAYQGLANTAEIMLLIREYPLDNLGSIRTSRPADPADWNVTAVDVVALPRG